MLCAPQASLVSLSYTAFICFWFVLSLLFILVLDLTVAQAGLQLTYLVPSCQCWAAGVCPGPGLGALDLVELV